MTDISGWRKRQIALDQKAENARELGLDYGWVGLTDDEVYKIAFTLEGEHWKKIADAIGQALKEKNT